MFLGSDAGQGTASNTVVIVNFTHLLQSKQSEVRKEKFSPYRPGVAQRVGTGLALHFHHRGTRRGVSGQQHAPAALYPRKRLGTHCTGGWVGPRVGLDGRKISTSPELDPGSSRP